MAEVGNAKRELDESKYSSPVPVIGLYIAGATLVCFLLILADILNGIRHKRRWLPCRWFSLNSVTLTLLSIVTKLPVDLTTPMPSARDQFSKLTSNILLCTCMNFLMPSLGTMKFSECLTNVGAINILAVTITVNICIQLYTGVIFLFKVEHIIVMCCMMLLLLLLWCSTLSVESIKETSIDRNKNAFVSKQESLLRKLKLCYLYGFDSNAQFAICKQQHSITTGIPCVACLAILVEVACRSLIFKNTESYDGVSDYKWSTWIIIAIQIVTILLGSFGNFSRIMPYSHLSNEWVLFDDNEVNDAMDGNLLLETDFTYKCMSWLKLSVFTFVIPAMFCAYNIILMLHYAAEKLRHLFNYSGSEIVRGEDKIVEEFQYLIGEGRMDFEKWSLKKAMDDMMRTMKKIKPGQFHHFIQLLSKCIPSQESLVRQLKNQVNAREEYEVTSLTAVLLVKISIASLPSDLTKPLSRALDETFEIIHFVDKKMNFTNLQNKKKCKVAKEALMGPGFDVNPVYTNVTLNEAVQTIKGLKDDLISDFVLDEVSIITDFINHREYESIADLYNFMEQLFVDIVCKFLTQFPHSIFIHIMESDAEDFEERVRTSMKFLCQIQSLESHVGWSFPVESNITCLITDEAENVNNDNNSSKVGYNNDEAIDALQTTEDVNNSAHASFKHEILEIEDALAKNI